jgi:Flp pilus assembly protein TadG
MNRLGDRQSGAVAVEAALIVPLLLLILFGIIDSALYLRDAAAVSAVVRHGVRIASAEPRRANFVTDAADAVASAVTVFDATLIDELWVYQADSRGTPTSSATFNDGGCITRCVRLRWNAAAGRFDQVGGDWNPASVNACVGDPSAMSVGVYLRMRHTMLFPILTGSLPIRVIGDRAVMHFEPLPTRDCGVGVR